METNYGQEKIDRQNRRDAERQRHKRGVMRDKTKKLFALFVIVLVVAGLIGSIIPFSPLAQTPSSQQVGEIPAVVADDWMRGSSQPAATVVEYADFQCPACASYHGLLKRLEQDLGGRVSFVFRHYPLTQIHGNALLASYAAEAAGAQGKFWQMHDMLYENQRVWSESANARTLFIDYARGLGLDSARFEADLSNSSIADKVTRQQSGGTLAGVDSTPSFFLNGKRFANPSSYDELKSIVESALPALP
jgi:protein-disulfide isomerase